MGNEKAETRFKADSPVFLYVSDLKRDFPGVANFANLCELPDCFEYTESRDALLDKIARAKMTAKIHVVRPGAIQNEWESEPGTTTLTVADVAMDGSWHIAVQTIKGQLCVGWLLTACGYYIEQIASGNGYRAGKLELRGTSFDQSVILFSHLSGIDGKDRRVRQSANSLVAIINGAWLAWHFDIDTKHSAADFMVMVVGEMVIRQDAGAILMGQFEKTLVSSLLERKFFQQHVEQIGWTTEKGMCLTMDAATALLLRRMKDSLKGGR